jgi:hypothetical protein
MRRGVRSGGTTERPRQPVRWVWGGPSATGGANDGQASSPVARLARPPRIEPALARIAKRPVRRPAALCRHPGQQLQITCADVSPTRICALPPLLTKSRRPAPGTMTRSHYAESSRTERPRPPVQLADPVSRVEVWKHVAFLDLSRVEASHDGAGTTPTTLVTVPSHRRSDQPPRRVLS